MKLGFILLDNVTDANNFKEIKELTLTAGNPSTLYFRLVQLDKDPSEDFDRPLRFIPPSGATAQAGFDALDDQFDLSLVATQPFTDDKSIWSIPILPDYKIGPDSMSVRLTYSGNTYNLEPVSEIRQSPTGQNRFFC